LKTRGFNTSAAGKLLFSRSLSSRTSSDPSLVQFPKSRNSFADRKGQQNYLWCLLDDVRTFFDQNPEDFAD
jgi:hypothetical protein